MDPDLSSDQGVGAGPPDPRAHARAEAPVLGRELGGDLPCVVCGYNLRGLSIRGVCPECGAGVRATILAVVDPHAAVLRPIARPRLVAGGLVLWAVASLLAAVICWIPHGVDALARFTSVPAVPSPALLLVACIALAGLGLLLLVRPHSGIPPWQSAAMAGAAILHVPLGYGLVRLYRTEWPASQRGLLLSLLAMSSLAAALLLMRPIVRLLVARSLLLRSGKVDRQTLYGMAAAAMLLAAGHALLHLSMVGWVGGNVGVRVLGFAVVVIGGALLTLGLLGSVVDAIRIARAILRPRLSVRQVVRRGIQTGGPHDD